MLATLYSPVTLCKLTVHRTRIHSLKFNLRAMFLKNANAVSNEVLVAMIVKLEL